MLKRLELIGFKSFADKTRFEFAPGITAVVGPNGSGKSNIVDAVKWVLGEQSAKSLRGGEMADVIFNGSSTRKSLGMAEVTMTFDNARRTLPFDGDEVQITRRVYRDGQGEYLINGQVSRLKDIKDLFLGSGAGHGAYSVIEQGRVDALLTASNKDRRTIFEEAAGISRFRVKKTETLRKLERVEADLLRVRDILQELDKQLRTLRLQAAKAQRYQEYTTRLKALRVGLGLRDYRELSETLSREAEKLESLNVFAQTATQQAQDAEVRLKELERTLAEADRQVRGCETEVAAARQQIASMDATIRSERSQSANLDAEMLRLSQQRFELGLRMRVIEIDLARSTEQFEQMSQNAASEQATADAAASALAKVAERIGTLTRQTQADRERQFQLVGRLARLQSDTETLHAEQERLRRELSRKLSEGERTQQQHDALGHVLGELSRTDADLQWQLNGARQNLAEHLSYREDLKKKADALQVELETLRESRSSLRGRVDVLEGLERNLEGIDSGVREVLARMKQGHPVLSTVLAGLVADLISAPRDVAPLIDVALGELAQRFVVTDSHRFDELLASLADLPGRVGFVPLHLELAPPRPSEGLSVWNADAYVRVDHPDLTELPRRLLGNVLLVADLATARTLQRELPGYRILTRQGEILEADGSFAVGPLQAGAGILSRKSELRELREQVTQLDREVERLETQQLAHRRQAEALEAPIRALETEITALSGEAGSLRDRIRDQRQVQQQLAGMLDLIRREASQIEGEVRSSEAAFEATRVQMLDAKRDEEDLKEQLDRADAELGTLQRDRELRQAENLAAQVALSRVREQLNGLRKRRDDLESELKQRRIDGVNLGAMERSTRNRLAESTLTMLRASAMAAHAYSTKEENERTIRVLSADREALRKVREEQDLRLRQARAAWSEQKDRSHAHELLVRDLSNRRESLESRIREEYGLELSQLAAPAEPATGTEADPIPLQISVEDTPDADEVQSEIDDLRKKIAKLGSVNLEALDELAQIEKRETDLQTQHDDLAQSQAKLQAIIEQINGDSRRLFLDLMNVVRGHFLDLFRKLFGGGTADIVLEENADPLESGIDVIARPPGKELRSISLLSGGERTMTAIALLLALFRSRPSPFCLLDEVDAALDEANTARLSMAIREFLDRSQFIVITHKKRTMATADVLYGISMQESGVSKQVAVRFEDWPDDPSPVAAVSEGEAGKAGYGGS